MEKEKKKEGGKEGMDRMFPSTHPTTLSNPFFFFFFFLIFDDF